MSARRRPSRKGSQPGRSVSPGGGGGGSVTLFVVFALSGATGLVYESIWSRYLGLFLGHSAFSQALVLAIFMGGMAVGAGVCGRFGPRWRRTLRGYALAEAGIGAAGLLFPHLYSFTEQWALGSVLPHLGSPLAASAFRWIVAGLLILPQSVLLGMTFPLMAAGLLRRRESDRGGTVAILYFFNSAGAAVGALASGLLLVDRLGLPGTISLAGAVNLFLAIVVWLLSGPRPDPPLERAAPPIGGASRPGALRLFLAVAVATGAASMVYEIAWTRMLSLVLGSSARAFELMLATFVAGLALGGLWIRGRIERLETPVLFLAGVQVAMGLLALATAFLYDQSFEAMRWLVESLPRTPAGYQRLDLARQAIAAAVMLPATFCAGTTLPLVTEILLRRGYGEKSLGAVYGWNTFGSIAGVLAAVHLGMPLLGLKGLLASGAALDVATGVVLLAVFGRAGRRLRPALLSAAAFLILAFVIPLDVYRMASGVYRFGTLLDPGEEEVLYHRDGKTATVSVTREADGSLSIRTQGKSDANLALDPERESIDEHTMVLTAAVPLALRPDAKTVAVIGFGSGLTTHTLLGDPDLRRVDTVEIEPRMVEGARLFGPRVERAFLDPRSRIVFDDARSFFAREATRYDLILSEPSNPWVRGVSSLFTRELYHQIRGSLAPGGLLAQWLQYYELDLDSIVSVLEALSSELADFDVYVVAPGDLLIVASADGPVPDLDPSLFDRPEIAATLARLGIHEPADLGLRWLADRRGLEPFLDRQTIAPHSDLYPTLEHRADLQRFLGTSARELFDPDLLVVPVFEMLGDPPERRHRRAPIEANPLYERTLMVELATTLRAYESGGEWSWPHPDIPVPDGVRDDAELAREALESCDSRMPLSPWFEGLHKTLARRLVPFLAPEELTPFWPRLLSPACRAELRPVQIAFAELWRAVSNQDAAAMSRSGRAALGAMPELPSQLHYYALSAALLGDLAREDRASARELWERWSPPLSPAERTSLRTRVLLSHAFPEG